MFKFPEKLRLIPLFDPQVPADDSQARNRSGAGLVSWMVAGIAGITLLVSGDTLLDLLANIAALTFDLVEETLEDFYRKSAKLDLRHAQMAAAYTYFAVALVLTMLLVPRVVRWWNRLSHQFLDIYEMQSSRAQRLYSSFSAHFMAWWELQDSLNRLAFIAAVFLGAVPLFLLLSIGLGIVVADLF